MGKIALGEVMNGRNDKGASWHWGESAKGELAKGQNGKWAKR